MKREFERTSIKKKKITIIHGIIVSINIFIIILKVLKGQKLSLPA